MPRCNKSAYAILGIIAKGEVSGYGIKKILEKLGQFYWTESNAQIYPTLKQIEVDGLLTSRLDESSGARQCRKYRLTSRGEEELVEWLKQPCDFPKYREELLLKVSLGQFLPSDELVNHINQYIKELEQRIEYLDAIEVHIKTDHSGRPDQPFLLMTHNYLRFIFPAKKQWALETLKQLKQRKSADTERAE